jgi:hypothetical protein
MRRQIVGLAMALALAATGVIGQTVPSDAQIASAKPGGTELRLVPLRTAGFIGRRHYAASHPRGLRGRHTGRGRYARRRGGVAAGPIMDGVVAQPGYGSGVARPTSIGPAPSLPPPPTYTPPTMQPTPQYYTVPGHAAYCGTRFRTYDPATNTYQSSSGIRRPC